MCIKIDAEYWLLTDLRVKCYTDTWTLFSFASMALVLLYPIGIPLFFLALLRSNRDKMRSRDPIVRNFVEVQLGFLYAGYRDDVWYFELIDMVRNHITHAHCARQRVDRSANNCWLCALCCVFVLAVP